MTTIVGSGLLLLEAVTGRGSTATLATAPPAGTTADLTRADQRAPSNVTGAMVAASGAVPASPRPHDPVAPLRLEPAGAITVLIDGRSYTHQVAHGDTLWRIAEQYLGDPHRWPEIWQLNQGRYWPDVSGRVTFHDPDLIFPGWTLALPTDAQPMPNNPPASTNPTPDSHNPSNPTPTDPTPPGPATTPATPGAVQPTPTPVPVTPSISVGPPIGAPPPNTPAGGVSPGASPPVSDAAPPSDQGHNPAGVKLPTGGWVTLGLAAAIAVVAAGLRLQRRRHARLRFPTAVATGPQPTPVPETLAILDAVGGRHLGPDMDTLRSGASPVAAPIGVNHDGVEVSLFDRPGPGIALWGDGAEPAARAILAAALTAGAAETAIHARPVVVTTTDVLARLLPPGAPLVGLDPDDISFDGDRLIVLADTASALTHAEEEMICRQRLLDTFDADTIADLNARTDHAEAQPPYVLLINTSDRQSGRVRAVAAHRAELDLHPVILGATDGTPVFDIAADGTTINKAGTDVARLATLAPDDLAAVLAMLSETVARPEPGNDPDDTDDPATQAPTPIGPAEPVPAQHRDTSALAQLRVLGPVTVTTAAGTVTTGMRSGSYAVLALTAAHPAGCTLDQFADRVYPDVDPTSAVKRIRADINTARRVLRTATGHNECIFIVYDPATGRYRLDPETVAVDLWQMLTAINRANTATNDSEALTALQQAAELYGGDFADNQDRAWVTDYTTTYRHQILTAYARIAEILETDHPDQAVAALERAADLDPVNEELYQRIMCIHGRQNRPDAVRRTLHRLEEHLADLNTEPSEATRRVADRQLPARPRELNQPNRDPER